MFGNDIEQQPEPMALGHIDDNETADWNIADQLSQTVGVVPTNEAAQTAEPIDMSMGDILTPVIQLTADIVAPNWNISDEESNALGQAWGAVIEQWMPDATLDPKWMVMGVALITTAAVAKDRAGQPLRLPPPKPEKEINKKGEPASE